MKSFGAVDKDTMRVFWYREGRVAELSMSDLVKRCKMDAIKVSLRTPTVVLVPGYWYWNGRSERLG
jgi:hypothetical protein